MLEKTDIVHANHYRHWASQGRRVLHVQKLRPVPAQLERKIAPQPDERIAGDAPDRESRRYPSLGIIHGQVSDELRPLGQAPRNRPTGCERILHFR